MSKLMGYKSVRTLIATLIATIALVAVLAGAFVYNTVYGPLTNPTAHAASYSTRCANYDFWRGGANGWYHMNSGGSVCYNGSQIWQNGGGPSCSVIVFPGYQENTTWCGIYNSGGSYVDVGMNSTWSAVWLGSWPCYTRVRINAQGSVTNAYATC